MRKTDSTSGAMGRVLQGHEQARGKSIAEAVKAGADANDHAVAILQTYGRTYARELADWYLAFELAGEEALRAPCFDPIEDEDDAASLFADVSAASTQVAISPRSLIVMMRRCTPTETARGVVRKVREREPRNWREAAHALFKQTGDMGRAVDEVLG